jgi:hypothetical protein
MEKPWKVIAAFLGVFVAGAVFGGFFSIGLGSRWLATQQNPAVPAAPAVATSSAVVAAPVSAPTQPLLSLPMTWQAPQLMRRYAEKLDLTPEQKERITPLIHRAIEDYRRVQQTTFRETGIILKRLQQDIGKELTPEQQKKLGEMEERQREILRRIEQRQRELRKGREKSSPEPQSSPDMGASTSASTSSTSANSESPPASPSPARP